MDFRILGPLEVGTERGRKLDLAGKQRALLAILLLHANEAVSTDRLIDELWGEKPPKTAGKALQVYISRLRKLLEPDRPPVEDGLLLTQPPGYTLQLGGHELDLHQFERLRAEANQATARDDPETAAAKLREALALWRGTPLADLAFEPFAQNEIARLEELRLTALEERIEADLALGRHPELVGELEALVNEHALRERLRGHLMLSLYRSGRQAEALEVYQEARNALVEELGIEPGRELRELHQAILRQDPAIDLATSREGAHETVRGIFVGREAEFAELLAGLEDAVAGRGRFFLLGGEPGIGKTRLADELIRHARRRGARVLVGRCWEAGGAPAYWPWVQSLRAYIRGVEPGALRAELGAGAPELAQILPELREHFPDLQEPLALESEGARFRLFEATAEFLRNASRDLPILLFLDDLHAADEPSLLLLQFLARELGPTRMLVLGAYRDVDPIPEEPLAAMLAAVVREPVTHRLPLGGLSEREVAEYLEFAASEIASRGLVTRLHEETEGNPLYVGEIVRLLSVEGIRRDSTAEIRLVIPPSIRDAIARRLTHLSDECNRVLVLASVLGREFALDALARVAGVAEDELLDELDEALTSRIVSEVPGLPPRLRFAHVLIRDTLYEGITMARRVRLHRQAVEALELLYGDEPGAHLTELASHSIAGGEFDRGVSYARRAGDRALELLAYEEAARLYAKALEVLDLSGVADERVRCELLLSLGDAEARAGNIPAAKSAFLDAARIAEHVGLPRELARAAAGYGGRIVWGRAGDDDRLVPLLEAGLDALGEEEVQLRARLLARLAGALRDEPTRSRRDGLTKEAVELARRSRNPSALAHALDGRAAAIVAPDTIAECLAIGTELREVAEGISDLELIVAGHSHRLIAQLQVGDIAGAEVDLAAASQIAEELRQPAQLWQTRGVQALLALAKGRLGEAEQLVDQALALGERSHRGGAVPVYWLQRYTLCDFLGSLGDVEPAICELSDDIPARRVFRCALVCLRARLGRLAEAKRDFDDLAQDRFSELPFDQEWIFSMSLLAEASTLLSDEDSAAALYELLLPWAALNAVDVGEGMRGSVSRYIGMLATATSRWNEATLHFEDALAMNERMGARPWLAHTQMDYAGRLLAVRDGPGDRERACELLDSALAVYRELGMEGYAAEALALVREL